VKSISDILNSMVHPTEQGSLLGGNQTASAQGPNSSVGSFSDVLNRLASQNAAVANAPTNTANGNTAANSNIQNTGSTGFSDISVTEVQVSEKVQSNDLNQATLSNIENAAVSMAMVLSKLVNLASNLQNLNQAQAQNLIVSASGGAISASQAQQLVTQIANLKNQNSGQNVLNLIPEQQNALLLQMMQSMVQNQQVTLTQSADTQNNQNSLLGGSQGSSSLQFNFAGNQSGQSGNAQVESISINIETLNLQVSNSNQQSQVSSANAAQSTNLTDATTQKLTQLLQQLNVTPSSTPVNIQVQTSVAATNSPEMTKNFQNLIQILTQAGAGQAVLSNYLTQSKNNSENSIFEQAVNQLSQTQNATVIQSVSVTAVSENESTNSTSISNSGQNNSAVGQARLLNDSLGAQNIQLTAQNPQGQSNDQVQAAFTTGVQALQTTSPITNVQVPQAPLATNVAQNVSVQPVTNQALTSAAVTNATQISPVQTATNQKAPAVTNVPQNVAFQPTNQSQATALVTNIQQAPAVSDMAPNNPIQPANQPQITAQTFNLTTQIPIATNVTQTTQGQTANNQPQPAPAASVSTAPVVPIAESAQNKTNQTAVNPNSQTALSQPRDVFSNGHLEALNGIVARFNNAVISGAGNPNTINNENNINQYPTETQVQNQVAPIQAAVPTPVATPITPIVTSVENVVLNNQNTQQANNLTSNNVQNQLVQPTSPIAQSAQNTFVQTASNTISNNLVNTTATPALSTTNNSSTTVNPPTSMASTTPVTQQIVTANQSTVAVTSASGGAPVSVASSNPVITQPVTNPASMTAQNVPAATVTGEIAKASMPVLILSNANSNNNAPAISAVSAVSASSSVQPVSAQAVSQTSNTLETSTNLNMAGNSAKDTLSDTTDLQNLSAMINSGMAATTDKTGNSFQNTVNTVVNSNPNGGVDSAQILNQITQQVAAQTADAKMVSRLSFQLVPESLGRVTVQVALVDQAISARITVSNPDVREVLQQHMVDLKAALSQAGLQIDQMQVNVQGGGAGLLGQYYQYQQEGSSYRESAWTPANTEEQPQNADNLGVLTAIGSNSVLNFLV
jgi:flagellar hook-length control protein FliK